MTSEARTQIYLQTPRTPDMDTFPALLADLLDSGHIACLRLAPGAGTPDDVRRLADKFRQIAHDRDVPVIIDSHFRMVQPLGLDGVHLPDGTGQIREARKLLGPEAVIGAYCGSTRHTGMTAAEMTCDYVAFGPIRPDPLLGDGSKADLDLFRWWSEMIEVPVVAEGNITLDDAAELAKCADFICLGDEIWRHESGSLKALKEFAVRLR